VEEGSARPLEGTTAAAEATDAASEATAPQNGQSASTTEAASPSSTPGPSDGRFADLNSYQLKRKLEETEEKIMEIEERQEELEDAMANPEAYEGDGVKARELSDEYNALKQELSSLYETWEALTEHVMALED
jgi:ATP-binding cassette subfamily F protein 3